ncbi:hypothetical protein [Curvibacter delicatus]|jgi:hypothetical protein|uniref:hypothetical protein n=1 Tax=Curvibacter delicatus TaxID=80879 RepID=UPI000AD81064|nr:hypothetical protein [Curvibacter delicatus]
MNKLRLPVLRLLPLCLAAPVALAQTPPACEQAWVEYNEFKDRTVMEASQYPLTVQGAAVRAACGTDALPAPPWADTPPPPQVRKRKSPPPPPPPTPPRAP